MKYILVLVFITLSLFASAQKIDVAKFYLNEKDLTAINEATKFIDDNNEVCALIRIQTTEKGFSFDGGTIGVAKVDENHVGEIWVYVPAGLRRISIRHQQLGSLIDYYFETTLEKGRTYIMELITGETHIVVDPTKRSQYLVVHVTPTDAMVEIEINGKYEIIETDNGVAQKYLDFGKYNYRVSMRNYHTESGKVTINDPNNKVDLPVELKPAYGWIEIKGDDVLNGANVYIDNESVGTIPFKSGQIASGTHDVRVAKAKHSSWRNQIVVNDGETIQVTPHIDATYASITLEVADNAEIWYNGQMIGRGNCTMDFDFGDQKFETKKVGHRTQSQVIKVSPATTGKYTLPAPIPINGSLKIEVKPYDSKVFLDDELVGTTPLFLQKVLIGKHNLRIAHNGMRTDSREVTIAEGETETVTGTLSKELNILRQRPAVTDGRCTISDEYDAISANLFKDCKNLRSITIPPTISAIGESAFSGCYQLRDITIPASIKSIEPNTFYWCAALHEVTIPDGVTSIDANAFTNCYGLESITLPSSITAIAPNAFTDCKSLKHIYVPKGSLATFQKLLPASLKSKLKEQ